ncbi:MAG: hypothetical protein K6B74_14070, partial [Ruminococcus sp.]|nr:hypothetical protein [Ruminococcus sp.]
FRYFRQRTSHMFAIFALNTAFHGLQHLKQHQAPSNSTTTERHCRSAFEAHWGASAHLCFFLL